MSAFLTGAVAVVLMVASLTLVLGADFALSAARLMLGW